MVAHTAHISNYGVSHWDNVNMSNEPSGSFGDLRFEIHSNLRNHLGLDDVAEATTSDTIYSFLTDTFIPGMSGMNPADDEFVNSTMTDDGKALVVLCSIFITCIVADSSSSSSYSYYRRPGDTSL